MKSKLSAALAAAGCVLAVSVAVAKADTQEVQITWLTPFTINNQANPLVSSEPFLQFNPALGTLESYTATFAFVTGTVIPSGSVVDLILTRPDGFFTELCCGPDPGVQIITDEPAALLAVTGLGTASFSLSLGFVFAFPQTPATSVEFTDTASSITYTYTPAPVPGPIVGAVFLA